MHESVLDAYPTKDLSIFIIWIKMYTHDTKIVAEQCSRLFAEDRRVVHFYDPRMVIGSLFAREMGGKPGDIAWDFYLFYERNETWDSSMPKLIEWVHQLGDSDWADPAHLYVGKDLFRKLREIMDALYGKNS